MYSPFSCRYDVRVKMGFHERVELGPEAGGDAERRDRNQEAVHITGPHPHRGGHEKCLPLGWSIPLLDGGHQEKIHSAELLLNRAI